MPEQGPPYDHARLEHTPDLLGAVYQATEGRRSATDQMMWQAPGLGLTAQAFLLTVGLQEATTAVGRMIAGVLGLFVALASMQLLAGHRENERRLSSLLERFERGHDLPPLNDKGHRERFGWEEKGRLTQPLAKGLTAGGLRGFKSWLWMLAFFALADVAVIALAVLQWTHTCACLAG